jgi:hypothetical protein
MTGIKDSRARLAAQNTRRCRAVWGIPMLLAFGAGAVKVLTTVVGGRVVYQR